MGTSISGQILQAWEGWMRKGAAPSRSQQIKSFCESSPKEAANRLQESLHRNYGQYILDQATTSGPGSANVDIGKDRYHPDRVDAGANRDYGRH